MAAPALAADTGDNLNPASTSFNVANSGNITFKGTINSLPVTVTCTNVTMTASTRASGLTADVTSNPNFHSSCTDTGGFNTDTVTSSGTWTLTLVDSTSETGTEPNSGDQLTINIPQGGVSFTSSGFPTCTVTANASTPTGSYDDATTATYSNANVSVSGSGCTAGSPVKLSGKFVSNKNINDTN